MDYIFDIALSYASGENGNEEIVKKVYYYLKAEKIHAFFAASEEGQRFLSGRNQRDVFYEIFGIQSKFVALFVSSEYLKREVTMEEANIAIAKHLQNATVIPIYLDESYLPEKLFDPRQINYYRSSNPAQIAAHLASKIIQVKKEEQLQNHCKTKGGGTMNISNNYAQNQIFIQK